MAKLSSELLPQVKSTGLARITNATSVVEAIATVKQRLLSATLVSVQDVLNRSAVAGVVLQGAAQANVLTGKDGTGRPHIAVRTNFMLANGVQINGFLANLSQMTTIEDVQEAYYAFLDEHTINGVIWDNEASWEQRGNQGKWSGYLRADATTGDVSISGLTPEKPQHVIRAKEIVKESFSAEIPTPGAAPTPIPTPQGIPTPSGNAQWKTPSGELHAESALLSAGWTPELLTANGYVKA